MRLGKMHRAPLHPNEVIFEVFTVVEIPPTVAIGSGTSSPTWSEKGALASASWWSSLGRDSVV